MLVMELFVMLLNVIKETALAQVEMARKYRFGEAYRPLDPKKVLYVLTVPALWDDEVNIFYKKKSGVSIFFKTMRECGQMCGMHHIEICFEPIAVTFAVISHSHSKDIDDTKKLQFFEDDQVVLLDMGRSTIDAACLKFLKDGIMSEIHHRDELKIGSTAVDQAFEDLLSDIFGDSAIHDFQEKFRIKQKFNPQAWLQQRNEFWRAKNTLCDKESWNVRVATKFKSYLKSTLGSAEAVEEKFQTYSKINDKPKSGGKKNKHCAHFNFFVIFFMLELSYEAWLFLHKRVLDNICDFVSKLLDHERVNPRVLIVTGGFSNCPYIVPRLQKFLSEREKPIKIYRPSNPHESVVLGSVKWAINYKNLSPLRAPLTLGWCVDQVWNPGDPDDDHKVSSFDSPTGYIRKRFFNTIIRRDEKFENGEERKKEYTIPRQQKSVEFELYKSEHKHGMQYCDDKSKCQLLKKFEMYFENPFSEQITFEINIILKNDRVQLSYRHPETGHRGFAQVKFEDGNVEDVKSQKLDIEYKNILVFLFDSVRSIKKNHIEEILKNILMNEDKLLKLNQKQDKGNSVVIFKEEFYLCFKHLIKEIY
ncbi:heat shock protein HSP70-12A-like protein [Reticulomyxa filosa]|uniref:Heat shock protein HSP70-12A-like protein n=1 Tax=Reticulomyxa filosa TaxID=46433 RepID=X6MTM2_RETFI|nr:heat shock protein HSP70-12A-like protein [Reticulomyxa filosa]|eukprot:ETO17199.1 heat shock protein HSP70-12A-like protein [Reticulomyxa filosa]